MTQNRKKFARLRLITSQDLAPSANEGPSTPIDEVEVTPRTREDWLLKAADHLREDLFKRHDAVVPTVRVSVGFPGGSSRHTAIGQYWPSPTVSDGIPQVFISPTIDEPVRALDILVHELIHAVHPAAGHMGPFKRLALAVGLTGKMTATVAGPELREHLERLADTLGPFPNSAINLTSRKKQSTRLGKVECRACGYVARVTRKWLDEAGAPICPCSGEQMEVL